jgi:hypothetical protein
VAGEKFSAYAAALAAAAAAAPGDTAVWFQAGVPVLQTFAALWNLPLAAVLAATTAAPAAPAILDMGGGATSAVGFTLPLASVGALYLVRVGHKSSGSGQLTANAADFIAYNGLAGAPGGNIKTTGGYAAGILFCAALTQWDFFGSGTWTVS